MLRVRARVRVTPTPNSNFHRVRVLLHERRVCGARVDVGVALHVVVVARVEERRRPGDEVGEI